MNVLPPSIQTHAHTIDPVIRHAYIHVPFCPSICPYCDFHVLTRQSGLVEQYLARLDQEAQHLANTYQLDLDTVYLGGGTPSFLRNHEMQQLVSSIQTHLGWGKLENTLEINPGTVSTPRAAHWKALGFDRASLGVQSLDNSTLKFLGRQHNAKQAYEALKILQQQHFRVSGDLITAVPKQPLEKDIQGLIDLNVEHISAYTLTIEPGTPFDKAGVQVPEEDERLGFERTAELLTVAGLTRYEISNYAYAGQESRHNLAYWQGKTYLGVGPSAAGHYPALKNPHLLTTRRTQPPLYDWLAGKTGEIQEIDPLEYITDALFMGLRLKNGVNLDQLSVISGLDVAQAYQSVIHKFSQQHLLELDPPYLKATPQGWWILNQMIAEFMAFQIPQPSKP